MRFLRSLLVGAAASVMLAGGALAADDLIVLPDASSDYTSGNYFEGFYWGLYAGGSINLPNNLHVGRDVFNIWHDNRFNLGVLGGYNFLITEEWLAGLEVQAGGVFNLSGQVEQEVLASGRIGYTLMDNFLLYASAGAGYYSGTGVFTVGGGVEWALGDGLGIRAEVIGFGELGPNQIPEHIEGYPGLSATRFTFGALWHYN